MILSYWPMQGNAGQTIQNLVYICITVKDYIKQTKIDVEYTYVTPCQRQPSQYGVFFKTLSSQEHL